VLGGGGEGTAEEGVGVWGGWGEWSASSLAVVQWEKNTEALSE